VKGKQVRAATVAFERIELKFREQMNELTRKTLKLTFQFWKSNQDRFGHESNRDTLMQAEQSELDQRQSPKRRQTTE
jgi:hypothetical protein